MLSLTFTAWTLRKKLRAAREAYTEQRVIFDELTKSLQKNYDIVAWEEEIKVWEADPFNHDDPYVVLSQGMPVRVYSAF